ncbi:MAG: RNA polymerase sigma factor [Lachnospiraceae bacterium]|nr:RNA polymerase sigma factor [Lachnospiraceae bacterium]
MSKELDHKYIAGLVQKLQIGDSDAFTEIYGLTYNKVYNYARHYLRDDFLAQDAVQEIFILAYKNISRLNDPTLFVAWLNQISFHVCHDISRKNSKDYGAITDPELLEIIHDETDDSNPSEHTEKKEEIELLEAAIDKLPTHEKQCIILRYYNDMKIDEIVNILGYSKSSVKRYLISGKEHLAEAFAQKKEN